MRRGASTIVRKDIEYFILIRSYLKNNRVPKPSKSEARAEQTREAYLWYADREREGSQLDFEGRSREMDSWLMSMVIFEIGSKKMPSEAGISFVAAERYWEYNCGMDPVRSRDRGRGFRNVCWSQFYLN